MGNVRTAGGGSMLTILATIVIVAAAATYFLDPDLFENIVTAVVRWCRFGQ